ncbi:hypothetical protein [Candidatus Palauibacter sp.]|uniref:hypothetical protein n=1 Tax=Candidatus Palauibacter sp. TaxID=3101350 RepID=UPI003CC6D239
MTVNLNDPRNRGGFGINLGPVTLGVGNTGFGNPSLGMGSPYGGMAAPYTQVPGGDMGYGIGQAAAPGSTGGFAEALSQAAGVGGQRFTGMLPELPDSQPGTGGGFFGDMSGLEKAALVATLISSLGNVWGAYKSGQSQDRAWEASEEERARREEDRKRRQALSSLVFPHFMEALNRGPAGARGGGTSG